MMNPGRSISLVNRGRVMILVLFSAAVTAVIMIKSIHQGWFEPQVPLELNGRPAMVFFTLRRGCVCQMFVIRNAEFQIKEWSLSLEDQIPVFRVDFDRHPELAQQYGVRRAPALVLLDAAGEVVWKQDVGLSDEAPLDLATAELYFLQVQKGQE